MILLIFAVVSSCSILTSYEVFTTDPCRSTRFELFALDGIDPLSFLGLVRWKSVKLHSFFSCFFDVSVSAAISAARMNHSEKNLVLMVQAMRFVYLGVQLHLRLLNRVRNNDKRVKIVWKTCCRVSVLPPGSRMT